MERTSRSFIARRIRAIAGVSAVGLALISPVAHAQGVDGGSQDGVEVLTRGPVHEAFAVPVVNDPAPGLVAPKSPPEAIEEMPPDQKPAGQDVQWIPGYWSWDQARGDFIWISGIWREPPPGRQWVPGYWNPVGNGVQWIPGAWIPVGGAPAALDASVVAAQGEPAYLPEPPASLEVGPNIPQPSAEVFWSPGCWSWRQSRYVWRPGFWAAVQPAWVWVPAHYVWTPGGCLFVEGYWDLPLVERGILFAPVYYAQPVYLRPAYVYTPTITIAAPGLVANLFVQPTYHHYCFGDYYDRSFLAVGVFPWASITVATGPRPPAYYDPLFTFYASVNRGNPRWASHCRDEYIMRRDNIAMRPPRTYVEQTRIVQNNINITRNTTIINNNAGGRPGPGPSMMIGRPIEQVAMRRREADAPRMERIEPAAREQWRARSREMADFRTQRTRREVEAPRPGPGPQARPRPFAMQGSPVAAPRIDRPAGPTRRPENVAIPAAAGPMRRPENVSAPAAAGPMRRPENVSAPAAGSARPSPRRPEFEPGVARGPGTPRPAAPGTAQSPPRRRPEPTVVGPQRKADGVGNASRPDFAVRPQVDRPPTPRPMRQGSPAGPGPGRPAPPAGMEARRTSPRRPPPVPRPMGPAARRAAEGSPRPGPTP